MNKVTKELRNRNNSKQTFGVKKDGEKIMYTASHGGYIELKNPLQMHGMRRQIVEAFCAGDISALKKLNCNIK